MENPNALSNFFDLMLSVLRIINSVVLARGHQNDQTVKLARDFLAENRLSMVSIFKRFARIGGLDVGSKIDLEELVEGFTLLISATGFLEVSFLPLRTMIERRRLTCCSMRMDLERLGLVLVFSPETSDSFGNWLLGFER